MKRSQLEITGEEYRLTPAYWGSETCVMIDEEKASTVVSKAFGEKTTPDEDDNDRPVSVKIATVAGSGGFHYCAIDGDWAAPMQHPSAAAVDGMAMVGPWSLLDDEEEQ